MKKSAKKLSLNRETVSALETSGLKAVRGGGDTDECVTLKCGFSWWTCGMSGCDGPCTLTD